jgi:hypothetical protein
MTILSPAKPRAKFPSELRDFFKTHKIAHNSILSVNPKTEKSEEQTYILHLAPAELSGFNVCPNAQNCKKVCLHFAGDPRMMSAKTAARIRRTQAFYADQNSFMLTIIGAIFYKINKQPNTEPIAIRLNGTSDICYENIPVVISEEFSELLNVKFGIEGKFAGRWDNIFLLFHHAENMMGRRLVWFYDYTKLSRNWKYCQRLGYHLTFSFDGWDNKTNVRIAGRALSEGVNVAAAFNIKRGQSLPHSVYFLNRKLRVYDGDTSDFRPGDSARSVIIGLRFKLPHGIKYTEAEKSAFCIA